MDTLEGFSGIESFVIFRVLAQQQMGRQITREQLTEEMIGRQGTTAADAKKIFDSLEDRQVLVWETKIAQKTWGHTYQYALISTNFEIHMRELRRTHAEESAPHPHLRGSAAPQGKKQRAL